MDFTSETSSISRGVFVYKNKNRKGRKSSSPAKGSPSKSRKIEHKDSKGYAGEPWYPAYKKTVMSLDSQVEDMYSEMFSQLLENVSSYLSKKSTGGNLNEIPTATILTGINLPDHSVIFNALEKKLEADISPFVVLLSSRTCATTRNLLGQILNQCRFGDGEEYETANDSDSDVEVHNPKKRATKCTFSDIGKWYSNQGTDKPIVVVLTDFETFTHQVLEDFIYLASEHRENVPMVLVFGVATTESAVHNSLPHRIMSRLAMESFSTQNSKDFLNHLINNVILTSKCTFRVGGDIFKMLTDIFLFYDFSIQSFLQKFKFCLLIHFAEKGVFAIHSKEDQTLENMKSKDLANSIIPKLKSFRKFVEQLKGQRKLDILCNDNFIKATIIELESELLDHFDHFLVGLKCLHEMTAFLPQSPLGRQISDLYFEAVSKKIWQTPEYGKCVALWKHLSGTELEEKMEKILSILEESSPKLPKLNYWISKISDADKKLKKIYSGSRSASCSPKKQEKTTDLSGLSRIQLQQQLKELSKSTPTQNKFEIVRDEALEIVNDLMQTLLEPPKEMPLHELLLFDNLDLAKRELMGNCRLSLNKALANPHHYLQCKCCEQKFEEGLFPSLPDVCISHNLHLEYMKHINLYDWLQSFNLIANRIKLDDDDEAEPEVTTETQARFTQSIADLQFLGFIKPTTRKADHVLRLTWGNNSA